MILLELANTATETAGNDQLTKVIRMVHPLLLIVLGLIAIQALTVRQMGRFLFVMLTVVVSSILVYGSEIIANFVQGPEETTPAPPVEGTATSSLPWDALGFTALALVLLAVVGTLVTIGFNKSIAFSRERKANIAGWNSLITRHEELRKEWSSYETDMVKIIDFPMMNDMREPLIRDLQGAVRKALYTQPSSVKTVAHIPHAESPFAKAVHEFDVALHAAIREAKRMAWSKFTEGERKRLLRAKELLALAMDSAASPSERLIACKRVIKELDGLVSVSARAMLAIESTNQLELTAV